MADWGTPPGLIDNEPRSDSPANDMRIAKLERRRRILEEQEKKKRRHQLGKIERNEVSSARRRDGGKTPLVNSSTEGAENHSRYAYDNPEAYNDANDTPSPTTSVKVVNVAQSPDTLDDTDSESLSDHDNTISSIPAMSQSHSQSSVSSRQQTPPTKAQPPSPQPPPPAAAAATVVQKEKKREKKSKRKQEQAQQQAAQEAAAPPPQRIEETPARAFGSDDEDELETAVIPDSHLVSVGNSMVISEKNMINILEFLCLAACGFDMVNLHLSTLKLFFGILTRPLSGNVLGLFCYEFNS